MTEKICVPFNSSLTNPEDLKPFQRLLDGSPGNESAEHLRFVCLTRSSAQQQGQQVREALAGECEWRRAEELLTHDDTRVSIFFVPVVDLEKSFITNFDKDQTKLPTYVFLKSTQEDTERLLFVVKPHVSFIQYFENSIGGVGVFLSDDGRTLHLSARTCYNGGLLAFHYLRFNLVTDSLVAVMANNCVEDAHKRFVAQFTDVQGLESTFSVVLNILQTYRRTINAERIRLWTYVLKVESATGTGFWKYQCQKAYESKDYDSSDAGKVYSTVSRLKSCAIAVDFQIRLLDDSLAASKVYWEQRKCLGGAGLNSQTTEAYSKALDANLLCHGSGLKCLASNLDYVLGRARDQIPVIEAGINHSRAEKSATSTNVMIVLAVVGIVFLPCALVAQLATSPYFKLPTHRWTLVDDPTVGTLGWVSTVSVVITAAGCGALFFALRAWNCRSASGRIPVYEQV